MQKRTQDLEREVKVGAVISQIHKIVENTNYNMWIKEMKDIYSKYGTSFFWRVEWKNYITPETIKDIQVLHALYSSPYVTGSVLLSSGRWYHELFNTKEFKGYQITQRDELFGELLSEYQKNIDRFLEICAIE